MRTFPLLDDEGRLHAFEIGNHMIRRRGVVRVVNSVPNAKVLKKPRLFSWFREDVFCRFSVGGKVFSVEEPFGDNSRYLVGAEPPGWCEELETVHEFFGKA